jgi:hypothetical protein
VTYNGRLSTGKEEEEEEEKKTLKEDFLFYFIYIFPFHVSLSFPLAPVAIERPRGKRERGKILGGSRGTNPALSSPAKGIRLLLIYGCQVWVWAFFAYYTS